MQLQYFVRDVIADVVNRMAEHQGFGYLTVEEQFVPLSLASLKDKDGGDIVWEGKPYVIASTASFTRTGELLNMEVEGAGPTSRDGRGGHRYYRKSGLQDYRKNAPG